MKLLVAAMLASFLLAGIPAQAADLPHGAKAAPNEQAEPRDEPDPLSVEIVYTAEVMANVAGGLRRKTAYLDNLDVVVSADLEQLVGWNGARLQVYGLYNNGNSISASVGDALAVSNIETGVSAVRLYEAWIEQDLGQGLSAKLGLYDLNSEFDALDAASLFVGSVHGIGPDISQTGLNGPSIFPVTSLALRLEKGFASGLKVRVAVLDAVPGNPDRPGATTIRLGDGEGALAIAEIDAPLGAGRLLAGHWRYTARFDEHGGGRGRGNAGYYLRGETQLARWGRQRLDGFFRLGSAAGRFNPIATLASVGVRLADAEAVESAGQWGLAYAHTYTSRQWRLATGAGKGESVFELTYRRPVHAMLTLQPHVQYIVDPSADPAIRDAFVVGLRAEFAIGF